MWREGHVGAWMGHRGARKSMVNLRLVRNMSSFFEVKIIATDLGFCKGTFQERHCILIQIPLNKTKTIVP